jgi:hypothetical protein
VNWGALLQPGVHLEAWQQEKLQQTVAAMSYSLGSSAIPWLQVTSLWIARNPGNHATVDTCGRLATT